ncbi:acylneuraminate cytidylyltransferase family protein [Paracoccaceae bacterium]|nr:acylneuraminate cytidylyltransferase family protein [Paracoccaceae bacterium]
MIKKLKTICIIPARGGSKGLPGKNIKTFNGKPLIAWPILAAKQCEKIDEILVTTDSQEIAEKAGFFGATVPSLRPTNLAKDDTTTEATLKYALNEFENLNNMRFDICVFLTCTDIFRSVDWITGAIERLENDSSLDSVFAGSPTHKNYWQKDGNGKFERVLTEMQFYSSRQKKKPIYREDTGLACASRASLWRVGKRIGDNVEIIINEDFQTSIDIHDDFDFFLAEKALEYLKEYNPEKVKIFL